MLLSHGGLFLSVGTETVTEVEQMGWGWFVLLTFAMADLHSPGAVQGAGVHLGVPWGQDGAARATHVTPTQSCGGQEHREREREIER